MTQTLSSSRSMHATAQRHVAVQLTRGRPFWSSSCIGSRLQAAREAGEQQPSPAGDGELPSLPSKWTARDRTGGARQGGGLAALPLQAHAAGASNDSHARHMNPGTRHASSGSRRRQQAAGSTSAASSSSSSAVPRLRKRGSAGVTGGRGSSKAPGPGELGCRHFGSCSGCALDQQLHRPAQYLEAVEFFEQRGFSDFQLVVGPLHGWRCRAKLAVRGSAGRPEIGLFRQGSHEVVDIVPGCEIHHPRINQAAALIKKLMKELKVPPYDESSKSGLLRYLQLTVVGDQQAAQPKAETNPEASVQVVLIVNAASTQAPAFAAVKQLADALWRDGGGSKLPALVHSIWAHLQDSSSSNTIIGRGEWSLMHGEEETWQTFGEGTPICLGPGSFVQANYAAFQSALASIRTFVQPGARVLELHAGVGAIGLSLFGMGTESSSVQQPDDPQPTHRVGPAYLRCVEVNPAAEAPFQKSRMRLLQQLQLSAQQGEQPQGNSVACSPSSAWFTPQLPGIEYAVASASEQLLSGFDTVIMDPPRKGLEATLLAALCEPGGATALPDTLIYLSCGWDALKREFDWITRRYQLIHARAFLFFPGTNAIETLCVFQRRKER